MFADFRASQTGDVITIVLAERTSAQRESEWQNQSDSRVGGSANLSNSGTLDGRFGLDARFSKDARNRNESVQSDLLRGTMTATVHSVDGSGNLVIGGERTLNVNGEIHTMKLTGVVRRIDIQPSNTVLSYQIADATIEYKRKGGMKRAVMKPGRAVRFGGLALLVAAFLAAG
jgi:flagellar L-ring protein precursor FlgH